MSHFCWSHPDAARLRLHGLPRWIVRKRTGKMGELAHGSGRCSKDAINLGFGPALKAKQPA